MNRLADILIAVFERTMETLLDIVIVLVMMSLAFTAIVGIVRILIGA
jgi:hypothetical protein